MKDQAVFWVVSVVIATPLAALFIHKIGAARALRIIGHAFIGLGDAVDHWKSRVHELNIQEREVRRTA